MDNQTRKIQKAAEPAEAEKENAAAAFGKFKDAEALWEAYQALEAEFTRRSQRLKELEAANKEGVARAETEGEATPSQQAETNLPEDGSGENIPLSDEVKKAVIEEYLAEVASGRGVPFVAGGRVVAAKRRSPQTLKEAGELAKNYFDNKED